MVPEIQAAVAKSSLKVAKTLKNKLSNEPFTITVKVKTKIPDKFYN